MGDLTPHFAPFLGMAGIASAMVLGGERHDSSALSGLMTKETGSATRVPMLASEKNSSERRIVSTPRNVELVFRHTTVGVEGVSRIQVGSL